MTYEQMKDLKPEACKRACGVHSQICEKCCMSSGSMGRGKSSQDALQSSRWRISS
jgi:hypothetical protein